MIPKSPWQKCEKRSSKPDYWDARTARYRYEDTRYKYNAQMEKPIAKICWRLFLDVGPVPPHGPGTNIEPRPFLMLAPPQI